MNFDKYRYQQKKKQKNKPGQKLKEIKLRPVTEKNDYEVKLRNLIRFLEHGDKVKVTVRFRGRGLSHQELGVELLERVKQDISEYASIDSFPKLEGRQLVMMVSPKSKK